MESENTVKNLLKEGIKSLKELNVQEPEGSAEFLLSEVLDISRTQVYANLEQKVSSKNQNKFFEFIERRKKHEPVWQIVGKVTFCDLSFIVNKDVLVPRPETEILIQEVLTKIKNKESGIKILDIGTGSGAIAVTLAHKLKKKIFASDISEEALKVAKKNAVLNKVEKYIEFKKGSLFEPWKNQKFDIICTNLPYIPEEEMDGLSFDVHHYEPRIALSGGKGGLLIYEEFLKQLPNFLTDKGMVFAEIGKEQGKEFCRILNKFLPQAKCTVLRDLAGIDRIVIIHTGLN